MNTMRLPFFNMQSHWRRNREPDDPSVKYAYFVGSANGDNKEEYAQFIASAKQGNLDALMNFNHIGGIMVLAAVLEYADQKKDLIVIESPQELWSDERIVLTVALGDDLQIDGYGVPMTPEIRKALDEARKVSPCEIFKHLIGRS